MKDLTSFSPSVIYLISTLIEAIIQLQMRVYVISVLLVFSITAVARSEPKGSLRLQFTSSTRSVGNLPVRIRFESLTSLPNVYETQLSLDNSGETLINLQPAVYTIHVETIGFDDYSLKNLVIKVGETTEVQANLDSVDELSFQRLPEMQIYEFTQVCKRTEFWNVQLKRSSFENEQQWVAWWSEFNLTAPTIDFKKWRVLAWMSRSSEAQPSYRIRRVTYNPKQKIIHARFDSALNNFGDARAQVLTCVADFVLIPANSGNTEVPVIIGRRTRY